MSHCCFHSVCFAVVELISTVCDLNICIAFTGIVNRALLKNYILKNASTEISCFDIKLSFAGANLSSDPNFIELLKQNLLLGLYTEKAGYQ